MRAAAAPTKTPEATGGWRLAILLASAGLSLASLPFAGQAPSSTGTSPQGLFAAVRVKDGPTVSRLLRSGARPNVCDDNGMTPLHYAASGGDMTSAMLLIAADANLNARDPAGLTPLHYAARAGSQPVANLLIVSGADVRATSRAGLTPAAEAAGRHHESLAEFLRERELLPPPGKPEPAQQAAPGSAPSSKPPSWPGPEERSHPKGTGDPLKRAFEAGDWTDDIEAAQQFSKRKRVPLLALFTGSDWCHFCKVLDAQVLSTSTFREAVQGKYVLLYVDFPRSNKPSREIQEKRNRFAEKYGVHSFPTLLILERGDRELDRIRGYPGGMTAETYVAAIRDIAR